MKKWLLLMVLFTVSIFAGPNEDLLNAVKTNDITKAEKLVENVTDFSIKDANGKTMFTYAIENRNFNMLQLLQSYYSNSSSEKELKKAIYLFNTKNYKEAFNRFLVLKNNGNIEANYWLGKYYCEKNTGSQNYDLALSFFKEGEKQNEPKSINALGVFYENGFSVNKSLLEATKCYKKAADLGIAIYNIGFLWKKGKLTTDSLNIPSDYYLNENNKKNMSGNTLNLKEWSHKDINEAILWYKKALDKNYYPAASELGYVYSNLKGYINYTEAIKYFQIGADYGYGLAIGNLGWMYYYGKGVSMDYDKALYYFNQGAFLENGYSMKYLGLMYENGYGVKKSSKEAMKWYEKSATYGEYDGWTSIGAMYYKGDLIFQNYDKAMEYFRMAADKGDLWALDYLGCMYDSGNGVVEDNDKALEYFLKAAEGGRSNAMVNAGLLYKYTFNNYKEARYWFEKASELGEERAKEELRKM